MNILITGGTGLIGQQFINKHPQHNFTVLTRSPDKAKADLPSNVSVVESLSTFQHLNDFNGVINLAGEPIIDKRWTDHQKQVICDSRWTITEQLVELIRASEHPPSVFISGSAIGIYGDHGELEVTERDVPSQVDFATTLCQRWESIAKQAEPYTRVVLVRTGIVLDHQGGALAKMLTPFKFCLGGKIGNGRQYMSWIHIQDMVSAMAFLLEHDDCVGPFNMVAPNPVTNQQFTTELAYALNRVAFLPVPAIALKLMLGESAQLLLDSQRVKPDALLSASFRFEYTNLKSALENLLL